MPTLTQINLFPIKSLGGVRPKSATLTSRGLEHDRRWMLVDGDGVLVSQRTAPMLSQLLVSIDREELRVCDRRAPAEELIIPTAIEGQASRTVTVHGDTMTAVSCESRAHDWFSERAGVECELVYMPDDSDRLVDPDLGAVEQQLSFADACPALVIGEASLADLNSRLDEPVTMDRFRANLVFSGGGAYEEDDWRRIRIGDIEMRVVGPCARCVMTTVDPLTSEMGQEPLKTLSTYRRQNGGVMFGQYVLHGSEGTIHVGDEITVIESSNETANKL